jgi:hypothetical protein
MKRTVFGRDYVNYIIDERVVGGGLYNPKLKKSFQDT